MGSESPPQTPSQNPPQTPSQNPPQTPSQTPMPPSDLEELTPEKKEEAERIALEDERVQGLIQGSNYELEVIGCMFPHDEDHCMLLLELENGEKYVIIVNMNEGIVEEIKEGAEQRDREGKGENNGESSDSP